MCRVTFSERINPTNIVAGLGEPEEKVRVLAISKEGAMLVLRKNGDIRLVLSDKNKIVTRCENVALSN